jgi:hypothetical protein
MANETTTISQIELDDATINDILGTPGVSSDSIMTATNTDSEKNTFFSNQDVVAQVLDQAPSPKEDKVVDVKADAAAEKESVNDILGVDVNNDGEDSNTDAKKSVKMNKGTMINVIKKMVDKGKLFEFEGDTALEDYTVEDLEQLLDANLKAKEESVVGAVENDFWQSLPQELQYAGKYLSDGGRDLKSLFKVLAQVEETKDINIQDESGQERVCREYLSATGFGDEDDVEEEINAWKDRGELENKATKFKPKLDLMQEKVLAQKLHHQQTIKDQRDTAARQYMETLAEVLDKGDLGGTKIDRKTQNFLWSGLLENKYSSVNGEPTNMLGHLLEKYQYIEPRHDLIAEALLLLSNPDAYKAKIRQQGSTQQAEKTVRMLKIEQANKTGASAQEERNQKVTREKSQQKIQRTNFFKRY